MKKSIFEHTSLEAIIQYLDGSADVTVKQSVEQWLNEESTNRVYFEKIKETWTSIENIPEFNENMVDKDWMKILRQIEQKKSTASGISPQTTRYPHFQSWLKIAAVISLVVIALGTGYLLKHKSIVPEDKESVSYNEVDVPYGQKSTLILSDGSKIWLNAGSKVRFPNHFTGTKREVWFEGEAFFKVAKNASRPFFVHTSDINIKVFGTSFNVKAYRDEGVIETTLIEGLVSLTVNHPAGKTSREVFLHPNHKAIFIKNKTTFISEDIRHDVHEPIKTRQIMISSPVNDETSVAWREGKLIFDNESFENIAKQLERRYDVKIIVGDEKVNQIHYSGVLKNISVEQAIKAIAMTTDLAYTIKDNEIIIARK